MITTDDVLDALATSSKPNDDPAYPQPCTADGHASNNPWNIAGGGMTLRDHFAGMALAGLIISKEFECVTWPVIAEHAYLAADAMLKEREKWK